MLAVTLSLWRNILALGTSSLVKHIFRCPPTAADVVTGKPLLTTEVFPYDLDTTSVALMVMKPDEAVVQSVMDEMLQYVNTDGIIQVIIGLSYLTLN